MNLAVMRSYQITFKTFLLAVFALLNTLAYSQTPISGIVNSYHEITSIDYINNLVTIGSSSGLTIGDKILIIQMQGAQIDESQSSSFGTITNLNNAGRYEIQTVCNIQGNDILLKYDLVNSYDVSGSLQLVRIPVYSNAIISGGDLTAQAWDGTLGGILAIEVTGTLDMGSQNINVSGLGFRGGSAISSGQNCSWLLDGSYYSNVTSTDQKAMKGEGVAKYITTKECGRGPQGNGGGGGNNHNGGGGGGGNFGFGGGGGERKKSSSFTCGAYTGVNSRNLSAAYLADKVFMGGGGGAGHVNNAIHTGEHGANGGGIVMIIANAIVGNGKYIYANGNSNTIDASNDGGGGGGAGGSILLEVNSFTSQLNTEVKGGRGASVINTGTSNCNGPGGGGGGGVLLFNAASLPGNLSVNHSGGAAGTISSTDQSNCSVGSTNGAGAGQNGSYLSSNTLTKGVVDIGCLTILPVEIGYFNVAVENNKHARLDWMTYSEINNHLFEIERSADAKSWETIGKIMGSGNSSSQKYYQFFDRAPLNGINYYRLKQIDFDGRQSYSLIRFIKLLGVDVANIYPNPATDILNIDINTSEMTDLVIDIIDISGKLVKRSDDILAKGFNTIRITTSGLDKGVYFVNISASNSFRHRSRLIITH